MGRKLERPSLEEHIEIGYRLKKVSEEIVELAYMLAPFIRSKDVDRLLNITLGSNRALSQLQSDLEDKMFADNPWLTNKAFGVYYGTMDDKPLTADELREDAIEHGAADRNYWGGLRKPGGKEFTKSEIKSENGYGNIPKPRPVDITGFSKWWDGLGPDGRMEQYTKWFYQNTDDIEKIADELPADMPNRWKTQQMLYSKAEHIWDDWQGFVHNWRQGEFEAEDK